MAKRIGKLSKRYAAAFLKAIGETAAGNVQELATELRAFCGLWQRERELSQQLLSPMFSRAEREKALVAILKELKVSTLLENFLTVLFRRDRLAFVGEIATAFSELADQAAGLVRVCVLTARNLPDAERQKIQQTLRPRIKGQPEFEFLVDPSLIGGMVVRYGGQVLDGSLSGRLAKLEQSLTA